MPENNNTVMENVEAAEAAKPAKRRGRPRKNPAEAAVETKPKKTAAKKTAEPKAAVKEEKETKRTETVVLQFAGREIAASDLIKKAAEAYAAAGNSESDVRDVRVYVKPEEKKAYYVVNDTVSGCITL